MEFTFEDYMEGIRFIDNVAGTEQERLRRRNDWGIECSKLLGKTLVASERA